MATEVFFAIVVVIGKDSSVLVTKLLATCFEATDFRDTLVLRNFSASFKSLTRHSTCQRLLVHALVDIQIFLRLCLIWLDQAWLSHARLQNHARLRHPWLNYDGHIHNLGLLHVLGAWGHVGLKARLHLRLLGHVNWLLVANS